MDKYEFHALCQATAHLMESVTNAGWGCAESSGPMPHNLHGAVFARMTGPGKISVSVAEPPNRRGYYEVELSVAPLRRGKAVVHPRDVTGSRVDIRGWCQPQTMPVFLAEQIRSLAPIADSMHADMLAALDKLSADYARRDAVVSQLNGWGFAQEKNNLLVSPEDEPTTFSLELAGNVICVHVPMPSGPRASDISGDPITPVCTISVSFPHENVTQAVAKIVRAVT